MAVIPILHYPNPRLQTKARLVTDVHDPLLQKTIDDMLETLYATPDCGGLAATQLDIVDPPFVTVIDIHQNKKDALCLINHEIVSTEGEVFEAEGCMSVYPSAISCPVKRPAKTKIRALDREGNVIEMEEEGYFAKCFVHEYEHLIGKLYIDHLTGLKRALIDKKIEKIRRHLR